MVKDGMHRPSRRPAGAPAMAPELPSECLHAIFKLLPPNCIPLAIRQLSKEMRQHYLQHTTVDAGGDAFLPAWAVVAAAPHVANGRKPLLMTALARRGELNGMQQLAQQGQHKWFSNATLCAAAAGGHLAAVQWLVQQQGCRLDSTACTSAASTGQLHVLQWLRCQQPPCEWGYHTCKAAARGGHLATLQWLRASGCPWDREVCSAAARAGQLETLSWCLANGCPSRDEHLATHAAMGGHLEILQHMKQQGRTISSKAMTFAACHGHVHVLLWLLDADIAGGLLPWCWTAAAHGGHIEVLQHLRSHNCPLPAEDAEHLCTVAAAGGHTSALSWLREQGHPWGAGVSLWAVQHCQFRVLRWLREQTPPCAWDERVTKALVVGNLYGYCRNVDSRMECLQWALDSGCPWSMQTYRLAQADSQLKHVRFPGVRRSQRLGTA